jgi:hypothetical protein
MITGACNGRYNKILYFIKNCITTLIIFSATGLYAQTTTLYRYNVKQCYKFLDASDCWQATVLRSFKKMHPIADIREMWVNQVDGPSYVFVVKYWSFNDAMCAFKVKYSTREETKLFERNISYITINEVQLRDDQTALFGKDDALQLIREAFKRFPYFEDTDRTRYVFTR